MAGKLVLNRLNQSQLNYLFTIRGLPTGTVDKMRKCLSRAIKLEKEGVSLSYPTYPYTSDEDKSAIGEVIATVETSINDIQFLTLKSKKYLVNEIHLKYALTRLDHVSPKTSEEEIYKKETYAKVLCLLNSLDDKTGITAANDQQGSHNGSSFDSGDDESLMDLGGRNVAASTPRTVGTKENTSNACQMKPVPVYRWGFRFSGEKNGMSVHAFLQRVGEMCEARGVTKTEVLHSAIDLFEGGVLIWYRAVRDSIVKDLQLKLAPNVIRRKTDPDVRNRTVYSD